jgi:hypothetical protein
MNYRPLSLSAIASDVKLKKSADDCLSCTDSREKKHIARCRSGDGTAERRLRRLDFSNRFFPGSGQVIDPAITATSWSLWPPAPTWRTCGFVPACSNRYPLTTGIKPWDWQPTTPRFGQPRTRLTCTRAGMPNNVRCALCPLVAADGSRIRT